MDDNRFIDFLRELDKRLTVLETKFSNLEGPLKLLIGAIVTALVSLLFDILRE